jgi:hypothetical protein
MTIRPCSRPTEKMRRVMPKSDEAVPSADHIPGFWVRLIEAEARAIITGDLPDSVRYQVAAMMNDYDTHLRIAEQELAKRGART